MRRGGAVRGSLPRRALAVAVGVAIDRRFGEPPIAVHPVAVFGRVMTAVESRTYRDSRPAGVVHAAVGIGGAFATGRVLRRLLGPGAATAMTTAAVVAGRMLGEEATLIGDLLTRGDLEGARERLPSLVGRSPAGLPETEIARAVVESVAENAIDAVVAPVFWAMVGGAPAALVYRAINTLDAMVGHRSPRYNAFGWTSARVDDLANWIPARLGALCVAIAPRAQAGEVLRIVRRDAHQHPSPNGGVIESAFAAALGIRLGGTNRYGDVVEQRGVLGDGRPPEAGDIGRAVTLLRRVTWTSVGVAVAVVGVAEAVLSQRGHSTPLASAK